MANEKKSSVHSENGFTLLEMIVAITLVAMMAVGIWSVFRTSLRAWAQGTDYIDASQRRRNILDMVRKQLASAYPVSVPQDEAPNSPPHPIFYGTESGLRFVSLNSLHFHESPGLTLAHYEVTQDPQGEYSLEEKEEPYLGQLPGSGSGAGQSESVPLFGNLAGCYFEYRTFDDSEIPNQWVREWDAEEEGRLPEAISMTMVSTEADGGTRNRQIVVPIHAAEGNMSMNILNGIGIPGRGGMGRRMGRGIEEIGSRRRMDIERLIEERLQRGGLERGMGREIREALEREFGRELERRRIERGRDR